MGRWKGEGGRRRRTPGQARGNEIRVDGEQAAGAVSGRVAGDPSGFPLLSNASYERKVRSSWRNFSHELRTSFHGVVGPALGSRTGIALADSLRPPHRDHRNIVVLAPGLGRVGDFAGGPAADRTGTVEAEAFTQPDLGFDDAF